MDGAVVASLTFLAGYGTLEPVLQRIMGFPVANEFHDMRGRIAWLAIGRIICYLSPAEKRHISDT